MNPMAETSLVRGSDRCISRRGFLTASALGLAAAGLGIRSGRGAPAVTLPPRPVPLKIGIRAASMKMVGDFNVIKTAAGIPGLRGVELQVTGGSPNLRDWEAVRRYKREADRWAVRIPSLSGVWDRGVKLASPNAAESILLSIRAAEMLGSGVIQIGRAHV